MIANRRLWLVLVVSAFVLPALAGNVSLTCWQRFGERVVVPSGTIPNARCNLLALLFDLFHIRLLAFVLFMHLMQLVHFDDTSTTTGEVVEILRLGRTLYNISI